MLYNHLTLTNDDLKRDKYAVIRKRPHIRQSVSESDGGTD